MKKLAILAKVLQSGIVAIVRTDNAEKAKKLVEAISIGGIKVIEVTMSVPGAIDVIKDLAVYCTREEITLGVGSVLDPETARAAILAGAEYVVTPCLNPSVIKLCNRYQVPSMPGAMSVKEVVEAMVRGAQEKSLARFAVAVSGVAGPDGGSPDKPVGTVWLAFGVGEELTAELQHFPGSRDEVRRQTVKAALEGLLRRAAAEIDNQG